MKPHLKLSPRWTTRVATLFATALFSFTLAPAFAQSTPAPSTASRPPLDKEEEITELEKYVVEGSLLGQAKAIEGTKEAVNLVNIISADKMGTFPDLNAAEALRRLPGVSISLSGGEGRFVAIRGAAPNYNGTLLNGFSMPSGDAEFRRVDLQMISNALIDTIVVTKAAMPDMPAQGIGGMTNIILRSPLSLEGREVTLSAYYGNNEYGGSQDREDFTYGDFIGKNKRFAIQVSGNHRKSDSFFNETEVFDPTAQTTATGGTVGLTSQVRYQQTEATRKNIGFDIALAAKIGNNTELVARGFDSDQEQDQFVHRYTFSGIAPFRVNGVPLELTPQTSLVNGRLQRLWRTRTWNLEIYGWQLTGTTQLGGTKLAYGFSSMKSFERYKNDLFVNAVRVNSFVDPLRITVSEDKVGLAPTTATAASFFRDPSTQRINTVSTSPLRNDWEKEQTPYVDATHRFEFSDGTSLELKSGLYFRYREKSNPNISYSSTQLATGTLTFASLGNSGTISNFDNKGIDLGVRPDPVTGSAILTSNASSFGAPVLGISPGDSNNYLAQEDIMAGYLMGTYTRSKLTVVGGARYETTDQGFDRRSPGAAGVLKHFDSTYDHWLPSLHIKYAISPNAFIRASWANTVGRPDAVNIYGAEVRDDVNLTINSPNPGLKPLTSENLDISLDWYTGKLGQFMVGAFSKDIENFPLSILDMVTINGATYRRTSIQPRSDGKITGWEASFRRNLDFLPGPLSGLGVDINYAGIESELHTPARPDTLPLLSQPEYVFNASAYYAYRGFFARLAMAEQGSQLFEVYVPGLDGYTRARRQWDFSASYEFGTRNKYQVFAEWRNITNAPNYSSWGPRTNIAGRSTYGTSVGGGVRARF